MSLFLPIIKRECWLNMRCSNNLVGTLGFFVIATSLFPFALGAETTILQDIGPSVIWVSALLAAMLSFWRIFEEDYEDGTLDQLLLSGHIPATIVMAKMIAHWFTTGIPLLMMTPLIALLFQLNTADLIPLTLTIAIGTLALSALGTMGAAITIGARRSNVLLPLLLLPLHIPILIFAIAAYESLVSYGYTQEGMLALLLLTGTTLLLLPISVIAAAFAVVEK